MVYNSQVTQIRGRQTTKRSARFERLRTSPFKYTNQIRLRGKASSTTLV